MEFLQRFCFLTLPRILFLLTPKKRRAKVFLIATETVVALAAPANKAGARALSFLKKRSIRKPLAIGFANLDSARSHFAWTHHCDTLLKQFDPNTPLTLVSKGIGFRLVSPTCQKLQNFLENTGPLYLTSANFSGEPPFNFAEAQKHFAPHLSECYNLCEPSQRPSKVICVEEKRVLRE